MTTTYLVRSFAVVVIITCLSANDAYADSSESSSLKAHVALLSFEEAAPFVKPHVTTWESSGRAIISQSDDAPSDFVHIMVRWENLPEPKFLSVNKVSGDVWLFMAPANCARLDPDATLKKREGRLRQAIGEVEYMKQHSKKPSDCFEIVPSPGFYL